MELGRALAAMKPEDLFPVWCWIDRLQERGEIPLEDALQWKVAIYGLMEFWELETFGAEAEVAVARTAL